MLTFSGRNSKILPWLYPTIQYPLTQLASLLNHLQIQCHLNPLHIILFQWSDDRHMCCSLYSYLFKLQDCWIYYIGITKDQRLTYHQSYSSFECNQSYYCLMLLWMVRNLIFQRAKFKNRMFHLPHIVALLVLVPDRDHKDSSWVVIWLHHYYALLLLVLCIHLVLLIQDVHTFDDYNPSFKLHIHSFTMLF